MEKKEKVTQKQMDYINAYNRQNYDRITVITPKGTRDQWAREAKKEKLSTSAFIMRCVNQTLKMGQS